jgi:hypothetical protein
VQGEEGSERGEKTLTVRADLAEGFFILIEPETYRAFIAFAGYLSGAIAELNNPRKRLHNIVATHT